MITKHLLTGSTVAGIAAAALALAACGSSGGGGTGTTGNGGSGSGGGDPQDELLAFAQCMREHGVDMPDPQVDSKGRVRMQIGGKDTPRATMEAAQKACGDKMPKMGGDDGEVDPAFQEYGLKLARCMREHGIAKFPDPTDGGIQIRKGMGIDPSDPAFQQAQSDCEQQIGEPPSPGDDS